MIHTAKWWYYDKQLVRPNSVSLVEYGSKFCEVDGRCWKQSDDLQQFVDHSNSFIISVMNFKLIKAKLWKELFYHDKLY